MNWIDVLIISFLIYYVVEGIRRGFIEQSFELFGIFLTLFLAYWTYRPIGYFLQERIGISDLLLEPLAFLVAWVILQAMYTAILRLAYPLIPERIRHNEYNRYAGLLPAMSKGVIIISVILTITIILPVPSQLKNEINQSAIGRHFVVSSATVERVFAELTGRDFDSLTFLTVPPQLERIVRPDERQMLRFTTTDVTIDSAGEKEMLGLVNAERQRLGLRPLVWDERLANVGRAYSKEMFAGGFFGHESLDGLSPFDRISRAGIAYQVAGENLAYAATVRLAHDGLMRSPGHRENILLADYGRIGIGVIDGGPYGKMITQIFTN